jgi:hypothetical protein
LRRESMEIDEKRIQKNVEYAKRWFNRSMKDFNLFKKLVPLDSKVKKPINCADPALAVYLLQQCIEKAVKAVVIASGQYEAKDYIHYYSHNSLALILNLNLKILSKIKGLGLDSMSKLMGIDLVEGEATLVTLENQVMGKTPLISKEGKVVNFRSETMTITPEVIDTLLDTAILGRRKILTIIKTVFKVLRQMGVPKDYGTISDASKFLEDFSEKISEILKAEPLSDEQLQAPIDFVNIMSSLGFEVKNSLNKQAMTTNYLGVWAFSYSLIWLSYLTFAHEGTSRYPLKRKGNVRTGRIGCDDYNQSLGIVNRIGQIGYATNLTLSEMKNEIENIAHFFAA